MSGSSVLRGRASECAALDDMLAAILRGQSRALVLRGEAGIGKTALLDHLIAGATDLTVLRAVGVESEMELAFAALHQLCGPLLSRLDHLPAPQRDALGTVFGQSDGTPPDRFLVGLAVLSLFSAEAEARPLLCVLDDAQWVDQSSALTLAFVARRLLAEPVGIVFATREPAEAFQHLPELKVRGVGNGAARALLDSAVPFRLDERVRDRIIAETRGNPLALLELPRGLTAPQLAGGFGLLGPQALSGRIEESFTRRLTALSDDARRLVLLAAAEPVGDPLLLWRASQLLRIPATAAQVLEAEGLLEIGQRVTFRHPLARSAVYRSASPADRRAVHAVLAEATDPETDPDRRAWHRAFSEELPDEQIATELELSAGRAQARGGVAAAAAFLQRAVALTADPDRRAERALTAAQTCLQSGSFQAALGLVATARSGTLDAFQRARVDSLRGHIAFASGLGSDTPAALLLEAAQQLEPFSLDLARETYLAAWAAAVNVGSSAGPSLLPQICQTIRGLPPGHGAPRPLDLLLDGLALLTTDGRAAATPVLQHAAAALTHIPVEDVLRWGWATVAAGAAVWEAEAFHTACTRQVQLVREASALSELPILLSTLAVVVSWTGDLDGAAAYVAEAEDVAAAIGSRFAPFGAFRVGALRGREQEVAPGLERAIAAAAAGHEGVATHGHWGTAVLYNGLGRYDEALPSARVAAFNIYDPFVPSYALSELVEAAARAGDIRLAEQGLERLTETTQPAGNDLALGIEARCRALLSEGAAADGCYREAIERLSRTRLRPELARAHLLHGEWLRREDRASDAREQLRTAHTMLVAIGMEGFAERARRELQGTGEKVRKRPIEDAPAGLTAQELQVARLAREGMSNPEIGALLFLSPRTVEWHLRKVFTKLGIRSRRELASRLTARSSDP